MRSFSCTIFRYNKWLISHCLLQKTEHSNQSGTLSSSACRELCVLVSTKPNVMMMFMAPGAAYFSECCLGSNVAQTPKIAPRSPAKQIQADLQAQGSQGSQRYTKVHKCAQGTPSPAPGECCCLQGQKEIRARPNTPTRARTWKSEFASIDSDLLQEVTDCNCIEMIKCPNLKEVGRSSTVNWHNNCFHGVCNHNLSTYSAQNGKHIFHSFRLLSILTWFTRLWWIMNIHHQQRAAVSMKEAPLCCVPVDPTCALKPAPYAGRPLSARGSPSTRERVTLDTLALDNDWPAGELLRRAPVTRMTDMRPVNFACRLSTTVNTNRPLN